MDSFNKMRLWKHLQNNDLKTHIMKHRVTKEINEVGMQPLCMDPIPLPGSRRPASSLSRGDTSQTRKHAFLRQLCVCGMG